MSGFELISDIWVFLLLGVVITGVVAGVLAGLLGVGGGIVLVPVLFWVLSLLDFPTDTSMHLAVGTSLSIIIPTALSSIRSHNKLGNIDWKLVKLWWPPIAIGALVGGVASKVVDGDVLRMIFGFVALIASINLFAPNTLTIKGQLPNSETFQRAISGAIGVLSALMGIGGGTLSVPTITMLNYDIKRAVGSASALGIFIAIPATIGFIWGGIGVENRPPLSIGYINLVALALIFPITVMSAPYGAKLANYMDPSKLKRVFALFLGFTSIRMLWSIWG